MKGCEVVLFNIIKWKELKEKWIEYKSKREKEKEIKLGLYEYTKYYKYHQIFIEKRKNLLLLHLNDNTDVVIIILNYLNDMEVNKPLSILFRNLGGIYLNDCGVVIKLHKIKIDYVRKHIQERNKIYGIID